MYVHLKSCRTLYIYAILSMIKLEEKEPKECLCPPGLEWLGLALSRGVVVS